MCGAGLYELAMVIALAVTVGILLFQMIPICVSPYLVVINARNKDAESYIIPILKRYSPRYRIDSKNVRQSGVDLIVEIRSKNSSMLVDELSSIEGITSVSLLYHDSPVKN